MLNSLRESNLKGRILEGHQFLLEFCASRNLAILRFLRNVDDLLFGNGHHQMSMTSVTIDHGLASRPQYAHKCGKVALNRKHSPIRMK
jgi:hypothetical protein